MHECIVDSILPHWLPQSDQASLRLRKEYFSRKECAMRIHMVRDVKFNQHSYITTVHGRRRPEAFVTLWVLKVFIELLKHQLVGITARNRRCGHTGLAMVGLSCRPSPISRICSQMCCLATIAAEDATDSKAFHWDIRFPGFDRGLGKKLSLRQSRTGEDHGADEIFVHFFLPASWMRF